MTTAYIMHGIPGSGKTTWAEKNLPGLPIISRDRIRCDLGYTSSPDEKKALDYSLEREVTNREYYLIRKFSSKGKSFIIDDTNTNKRSRKDLISLLRDAGVKIIAVRFNTPLDVCIKRRDGQIPSDVMQRLYDRKSDLNPNEYDELIDVPYDGE